MRTTKELLEVMLEHQDKFTFGLCSWASNLKRYKVINFNEWRTLQVYIKNNRPTVFSSWYNFYTSTCGSAYYWEARNIKPRIKWIKEHIKKLS
jgi:hypothetical protein